MPGDLALGGGAPREFGIEGQWGLCKGTPRDPREMETPLFFCFVLFCFVLLIRLHPWHVEVPRLEVKLEIQLPALQL